VLTNVEPQKAEECFKRSEQEMMRLDDYEVWKTSLPLINWAACALLDGRHTEAEELLNKALQRPMLALLLAVITVAKVILNKQSKCSIRRLRPIALASPCMGQRRLEHCSTEHDHCEGLEKLQRPLRMNMIA
jgi:hypothetical protein